MDETPPPAEAATDRTVQTPAVEVFAAFLQQGLTAFGGPLAHISYFRREFVERRGWLSEAAFADLLALAQFLPGATSSQLGMAIGLRKAGYAGMLAAWLGFTLPAAAAMIALGYFAPQFNTPWTDGVIHGLKIAAAAVVAQAVVAMARTLAVGPIRGGMAIGAGVGLTIAHGHGPVAQIMVMAAGALFGMAFLQETGPSAPDDAATHVVPPGVSLGALAAFGLLLAVLPFAAALLNDPTLGLASVFYRTGALVFGGGHVMLPLLQTEIVGRGWLDLDTFLGGYGAVQALPGPLFSFAGFVGAAQGVAPGGWQGGLVAVLAIFAPSLLLVVGVLPFWDRLKSRPVARGAMAGVNAVVVGLLAAALWNPVLTSAIERPSDWLVVIGFAAAMGVAHPIRL
ncbi:MAG TPA: chromate efflux transporter [Phenylobacterium sp.]